jgi:hydrogenase expression/formation protein HypD
VIGSESYERIARECGVPCVVGGFEPTDMLQAIWMLARQHREARSVVENQYKRVVGTKGNREALSTMIRVFEPGDSVWRGIGTVGHSGLSIREEFSELDAGKNIDVEVEEPIEAAGCICGEILKGLRTPRDCLLFGEDCTPADPKGACMVSSEGTCAAWYKYGNYEDAKLRR